MQPQYIGPYEVLAPLGAGGMGDVFLAHDTRLDRKVAIKRVRASAHSDSQRQILREARTVAHLNHPNIATVFDVVEHDSVTHIVMEYVEGETLAKRLRSGPLTPPEALGYVRQITDALAYAHSQGITHCDIKPSNVIIRPDGRAQVLDFGIARFEDTLRLGGDKTTAPVIVRGTPAYMAPELRLGAQPSSRSDVYSVGVLLFELLTKRRPYEGIDPAKLLNTGTEPPSLSDMVPTITAALSDLVSRAIAPDPQRRIGSIEELKAGLDEVTTVTDAVPAGRLSFAWRRRRLRWSPRRWRSCPAWSTCPAAGVRRTPRR